MPIGFLAAVPVAMESSFSCHASEPTFDRSVPRDLLPLPIPEGPPIGSVRHLSRPVAQRHCRLKAQHASLFECVWAFNFSYGQGQAMQGLRPSAAQEAAILNIRELVRGGTPLLQPEAALSELLGAKATAYEAVEPSRVAPYSREAVSWPARAGRASLFECVPAAERLRVAEARKHLLLPPSSEPEHDDRSRSRSYWDPALRHNPGEYHSFVRDLHPRGMIEFHRSCDQQVGVFFVHKNMALYA